MRRRLRVEPLERREMLCAAGVLISEFLASNSGGLRDYQGDSPDWIEIRNSTDAAIDLAGWYLTDDVTDLTKWQFPASAAAVVPAGGYQVAFASEKSGEPGVPSYELHTNFKLDKDGEYLALVMPDGTSVAHEYAPIFPVQLPNVSYGIAPAEPATPPPASGSATACTQAYFQTVTPGSANIASAAGIAATPEFSEQRGFYDQPFALTLTTATADAQIRYTLDGSLPTATAGLLYQTPISIASTSLVRAVAFKPGYVSGPVATNTYLFLDSVLQQSESYGIDGSGLPPFPNWGHAGDSGDWEVDPQIVHHTDPDNRLAADDLRSIPTMSLVLPWQDMFGGGGRGIYIQGEDVEKAVSVEQILPDGTTGFQIDASVQIVGGSSTSRWKSDKLSMRLKFTDEFGAAKLQAPLFGPNAADEFDTLVLDATLNFSWTHPSTSQTDYAKFIQDQHVANLQQAMGGYAPHALYHHLYINGVYWGMYYVHERPDDAFAASYLGGDKQDYDVIRHRPDDVVSGSAANYGALLALTRKNQVADANFAAVAEVLNIDDFIDYMLVNFYVGNTDWAHQNWYASFNRNDPDGKWRFHSWDAEKGHDGLRTDVTGKDDQGGPTEIHQNLSANAEYRLRFADRVQRHFFNDGTLTPGNAAAAYQALMDEVDRAIAGESARWGDNRVASPYTHDDWLAVQEDLLRNYFPRRTSTVLNQLRGRSLFPSAAAETPTFRVDGSLQHGGAVDAGAELSFLSLPGTIYYTLDGSDPRLPGGATSPSAIAYSEPIVLNSSAEVRMRLRTLAGEWSALDEAFFAVEVPIDPWDLAVTEIHYHPTDPTSAELASNLLLKDGDFEFLELTNRGSVPLDLAGASFATGIDFDFPYRVSSILAPGSTVVLVSNPAAFTLRYGSAAAVVGHYQGSQLDNSGEALQLVDRFGNLLFDFQFDDQPPWPATADGGGDSLQRISQFEPAGQATSWLAASPTPGVSSARDPDPGDANYDGLVSGVDLLAWQRGFGLEVEASPSQGDFNGDQRTGTSDLAVWESHFGTAALLVAAAFAPPLPVSLMADTDAAAGDVTGGPSPSFERVLSGLARLAELAREAAFAAARPMTNKWLTGPFNEDLHEGDPRRFFAMDPALVSGVPIAASRHGSASPAMAERMGASMLAKIEDRRFALLGKLTLMASAADEGPQAGANLENQAT